MTILVTGGAGYIGSHTVAELVDKGYEVVVIDNLEKGHRQAILGGRFYQGDLKDTDFLDHVFSNHNIQAIIHFAAYSLVGESMEDPAKYYNNNVVLGLNLLNKMMEYNTKYIVFSSTAAVYGQPKAIPITEEDAVEPTNPYGETKLSVERALKWYEGAYGIKYISLRYFNAAGAHIDGRIGEDHNPESHLIPIVLEAALGKRDKVYIFGDDYDTDDGTCVRDYIHVTDLADAHIKALDYLTKGGPSDVFNLGNGKGFSVKEIINIARKVTGVDIQWETAPRRAGDPAVLVASSEKARQCLGWQPRYGDISTIIETAWNWHKTNPKGYNE
ncbi:MAG: UDP-glucose 4-epimerase GalE [Mahellales bacterium]|jgi:UDP-glucose 4-epimerase